MSNRGRREHTSLRRYGKLTWAFAATTVVGCLDPLVEDPGLREGDHLAEGPALPPVPAVPGNAGPTSSMPGAPAGTAPIVSTPGATGALGGEPGEGATGAGEPELPSTPSSDGVSGPVNPQVSPDPAPVAPGETPGSAAPTVSPDGEEYGDTEVSPTPDDGVLPADAGVEAGSALLIRAQQVDAGDSGSDHDGGMNDEN